MTKLHKYTVSKMSLIQPVKFRTWETGLFKIPRFEMPRLQTGAFETGLRKSHVVIKQEKKKRKPYVP